MSQLSLNSLLGQMGPANVTGFFLVLARITPLFILAPLFSSSMMPPRVRSVVAVGLAIGLTPIAVHGQHIPTDPMAVIGLLLVQLLVGGAFAFAIGAVFTAVEAAGSLADLASGFSFGSIIDPVDNSQGGVMSTLYGLVGLAMFIAIGGDAWLLRGLARTAERWVTDVRLAQVNGQPGLLAYGHDENLFGVITFDYADGQVVAIRSVINPDKLRHLQ